MTNWIKFDYQEMITKSGYYYDYTYKVYSLVRDKILDNENKPYIDPDLYISPEEKINEDGSWIGGEASNGYITIYLYSILKIIPIDLLEIELLRVVIHELFHTMQLTDYDLYNNNDKYRNNDEYAVEQKTFFFMIDNKEWLESSLNITIDNNSLGLLNNPFIVPATYIDIKSPIAFWRNYLLISFGSTVVDEFIKGKDYNFINISIFIGDRMIASSVIRENDIWYSPTEELYDLTNVELDNIKPFQYKCLSGEIENMWAIIVKVDLIKPMWLV